MLAGLVLLLAPLLFLWVNSGPLLQPGAPGADGDEERTTGQALTPPAGFFLYVQRVHQSRSQ